MGVIKQTEDRKPASTKKARLPLVKRIAALQERVLAHPPTGKEADKEFFDWLSGEE